mgnify:CR=1 FL=1
MTRWLDMAYRMGRDALKEKISFYIGAYGGWVEIDKSFFIQRIRTALAFRKRHQPGATSFRVVNAESDFLSGLIVDKYEDVLVMQTSSLGMDRRKGQIVEALKSALSCAIFSIRSVRAIATRASRSAVSRNNSDPLSTPAKAPASVTINPSHPSPCAA